MSYSESNGTVTLTMTISDYQNLILALGAAAGCASRDGLPIRPWLELTDRINEGHPSYRPYTGGAQ